MSEITPITALTDAEEFDHRAAEFRAVIDKHVDDVLAAIELLCEASLTDPHGRGVLVTYSDDGSVNAELSSDVPWGTIHERRAW